MDETVVIKAFQEPLEANLARMRLEAEGIPCFLADENIVGIQPFYNLPVGGIKLTVREADAERAEAILSEALLAEPPDDGEGLPTDEEPQP